MAFVSEIFSPFNKNVLVVLRIEIFKELDLLLEDEFTVLISAYHISNFSKEIARNESFQHTFSIFFIFLIDFYYLLNLQNLVN
jgi:hypothetical protein